ncbi:MAG: hypothetical protein L3J34_04960 [Flavobacteriaceae bacterium]|nr:hypothetical protein [Flavobacteriaceae bacterium]
MGKSNFIFKTKISILIVFLFSISFNYIVAQDVTTIQANSEDISDNLDLEAVASIFGASKDLEDFEKRLNDPKTQISNLDLNNDGEVDYLRVMETGTDNNVHTISIQSIIGKDQFQEVATIDVKKDSNGTTQVQFVGNVGMYGPNYYITPVYPVVPVFFTFFWMAAYSPWHSPWYWGHHPHYWHGWSPHSYGRYHANVNVHINRNVTYNRNSVRINNRSSINTRNNSYFKNNPNKTFNKRNPGISNKDQLSNSRKNTTRNKGINTDKGYKSSGRSVTRPKSKPNTRPANKPNKTNPSTRPSTRPSTKPSNKPNNRPSARPSSRPSTRPSTSKPSYSKPAPRTSSYSRQAPSRSSYRRTRH